MPQSHILIKPRNWRGKGWGLVIEARNSNTYQGKKERGREQGTVIHRGQHRNRTSSYPLQQNFKPSLYKGNRTNKTTNRNYPSQYTNRNTLPITSENKAIKPVAYTSEKKVIETISILLPSLLIASTTTCITVPSTENQTIVKGQISMLHRSTHI